MSDDPHLGGVLVPRIDVPPHIQRFLVRVIDAHIPSFSDEDEILVERDRFDVAIDGADLIRRTCRCGVRIYGMYQYIDHLKARLKEAGLITDMGTLPNGGET